MSRLEMGTFLFYLNPVNMRFKNRFVAYLVLAGCLVLMATSINGCLQSRREAKAKKAALALVDTLSAVSKRDKEAWNRSEQEYKDSLEFERGQRALVDAQLERSFTEYDKISRQNKELIERHRLSQYADTTATTVPKGYIDDCEDCFTNLKITSDLNNTFRNNIRSIRDQHDRENKLHLNRIAKVESERDSYHKTVDSFTIAQRKELVKIQPKGRLYLSWGVLWGPWPKMAGAGLMYQNKYNLIWGAKCYYGQWGNKNGYLVETNINFPLSLKFR